MLNQPKKSVLLQPQKKVGWSLIFRLILNLEYQIIKIINKQNNNTKMKREFTKLMAALALLLFIAPLGMMGQSRAEGDTHSFTQSLQQLLNNNASISAINIAEQDYPVNKVTVSYRYNNTKTDAVTMEVTVNGVSWGTFNVNGTGSNYATHDFTGSPTTGAIVISFTNNTGNGTGHGTFYVNNIILTEGSTGGDTPTPGGETGTATITQSNLGLTGSYTTNTSKTIEGITYVYTDLMKNNNNIQAKASTGTIKNTTAYPGDITSVVITHSGTARATTVFGSADGTNWTQVAIGSGSITADFSGRGFKYFKITRGENAAYWEKIDITWGSAAAVVAPMIAPETGTTFHGSQQITISAQEGASIRYTTDGTEPTATTGTVYNGQFSIDATTTVKAVAYATIEGETVTSAVAEAVYTRLYNITLTQPFHGSISCVAEAAAGTQVTVTATPDVNYEFGSLTVTPTATVSNNTFTMPAADVIVTATFEAASETYTVSFSINGKIEMTATTTGSFNVDNFVAEVATEGMRFKGWYDNDTKVSGNYNPGTDKTLVAVFEEASSAYTLVTSTDQLAAGNLVVIAANGSNDIAMSKTQNSNNRAATTGIQKSSDYSTLEITGNDVCELVLGTENNNGTTCWTLYDPANNGYLYAASSSKNYLRTQSQNDSNGYWVISISNKAATLTAQGTNTRNKLQYNSSDNLFSCYASGQQAVYLYTKPAAKAMRDVEVEATSVVAEVTANVLVTVKADGIVYLTGNNAGNSANLVVEDGGQLVTSANVDGTMQKTVIGYGSTTVASNYYLITAPSTINPQNVEDMLNTNGYDLYYFDQSAEDDVDGENVLLEWRNYKDVPFSMEAGKGYLYANKENKTLNLAGTLAKNDNNETFAQDITYVGGYRFSGWNLVGNPFPSNAKVNMAFYKMNSNGDGINGTAMPANSVIAPMEGVFVIASAATTQVTFAATTDAVTTNAKKSVNIDVKRDNELMDRAIVSFNGSTLSKLNLNENATKVYFQQGQEEFAIVAADNEGELPVNFKASRNGRYTMSVNVEDLDMNYLHLIDNKTNNDIDLLVTPSYTFNANTGDNANRFRLVFNATGIEENASTDSETFAYYNGSEWVINNPSTGSGDNATLQVIDMMGRVLSSETLNGNANVNINQPAGIYMLRLVNGENVKVQKVVVR